MNLSASITRRTALRVGGALAGGVVLGAGAFPAADAESRSGVRLSTAQQVGQRVIFSYPGATPPDAVLQLIRNGLVGGVIFFGENITSLDQIADVVRELHAAHTQSPSSAWPLLLMTDQEGGIVRRLRGQPPELSEKEIGESADPVAAATKAGAGAGMALKYVGMDLNLAPVLDVFREPGNFDDRFGRSYSMDPTVCGTLGAAMVRAQQATGVAATAKHYPGLGAATRTQNTDLGGVPPHPVRQRDPDRGRTRVRTRDRGRRRTGDDAMGSPPRHRSHLPGRSVEEVRRRRATAPPAVRGVTITDALEAGALDSFGDTGRRAVLSAAAGMDLLLCSARDVSQGEEAAAAVVAGVENGQLTTEHYRAMLRIHRLRDCLVGPGQGLCRRPL